MTIFEQMGMRLELSGDGTDFYNFYRKCPYDLQLRLLKEPNVQQKRILMEELKSIGVLSQLAMVIENIEKFFSYFEIPKNDEFATVFSGSTSLEYSKHYKQYIFNIDKKKFLEGICSERIELWNIVEKYLPGSQIKYIFDRRQGEVIYKQMGFELIENVKKANAKIQFTRKSEQLFDLHFDQVMLLIKKELAKEEKTIPSNLL